MAQGEVIIDVDVRTQEAEQGLKQLQNTVSNAAAIIDKSLGGVTDTLQEIGTVSSNIRIEPNTKAIREAERELSSLGETTAELEKWVEYQRQISANSGATERTKEFAQTTRELEQRLSDARTRSQELAQAIDNARNEMSGASSASNDLADSTGEVAQEEIELASATENTADAMDKQKDNALTLSQRLQILASIIRPLSRFFWDLGAASFTMAANMEDAIGATNQIYQESGQIVRDWATNLETYYGIAESEALEYANIMGSLLQNIGGQTADEAAEISSTLIELAGDLTATFGGTTQDAIRALTGALRNNVTMLDNYGIAANDALIRQKALEEGISSGTGELTLQERQLATLALIMEQTTAAQGQAAREADTASGAVRTFTTELRNLQIEIGEVLLPLLTPLITAITSIIRGFGELGNGTQTVIVGLGILLALIGPLTSGVANFFTLVETITGKLLPNLSTTLTTTAKSTKKLSTGMGQAGQAASKANFQFLITAGGIALIAAGIAVAILAINELAKTFSESSRAPLELAASIGIVVAVIAGAIAVIAAVATASTAALPALLGFAAAFTAISLAVAVLVSAITELLRVIRNVPSSVNIPVVGGGGPRSIPTNGYARGTASARRGYNWVDETTSPRLLWFNGGETVLTGAQSMAQRSALNSSTQNNSTTFQIGNIVIDAKSVREFNDIVRIMQQQTQSYRQGYVGG